jgi:cyclin-A
MGKIDTTLCMKKRTRVSPITYPFLLSFVQAVPRTQLQLIAVACIMVAAKHEEELPPSVASLVDIADNSFCRDDLLHMESAILSRLSFHVAAPNSHAALCLLRQALPMRPRAAALAFYLVELAAMEYDMLWHPPSMVAAAATALAKASSVDAVDLALLPLVAPYSLEELRPCVDVLLALQKAAFVAQDSASAFMAVKEKYSGPRWHWAALVEPPPVLPASLGGPAADQNDFGLLPRCGSQDSCMTSI